MNTFRKIFAVILALLPSLFFTAMGQGVGQEFHGFVLKNDSLDTPIFQASILVNQGNQSTSNLRSLPDGSYKFDLKKSLKYSVKISYAGGDYADTTFFFTTDKNAKPSAQNVIVRMKRNGIWLTGTVRSVAEFFPIADATVIIKNVMTRKETRFTTGKDGVYRFRLEYDNNYRVTLDKRSDGIFNKYRDTVFYISTIGISQPLNYSMNIMLEEDKEKTTEPIEGYDPTKPANNNLKPEVDVLYKRYKKAIALPPEDEQPPPTPLKGESLPQQPTNPVATEKPLSPPSSPVAVHNIPPVELKSIPKPPADTTPSTAQLKKSVAPPVKADTAIRTQMDVSYVYQNDTSAPSTTKKAEEYCDDCDWDHLPGIPIGTLPQLKYKLKQAQRDLADLKKTEAVAAKRAEKQASIQKKMKEKNKGIDIVFIGDDTQSNLTKITQQRQSAEQKVKMLEDEIAQAKKK